MAGMNLTTYATFSALSNHWAIFDQSITTDLCDWVAIALVKDRTGFIGGAINDTKDLGDLFIIGKKAAITPAVGIFSVTGTLTDSQVSGEVYYNSAPWYEYSENNKQERNNYYYWESGLGSAAFGSLQVTYTYDSMAEFEAAIDNDEIQPIKPYAYFDVYIDGTNQPNIFVNWTAPDEVSPVLCQPRVWFGASTLVPLAPEFVTDASTNLKVPNTDNWWIDFMQSPAYAGSLSTTYLSIMSVFEPYLNPLSKVEAWGFDGIPALIMLYLRLDYGDEWGDLYVVEIQKDGSAQAIAISDSGNVNEYYTRVRLHTGAPDYIPPQDDSGYSKGSNIDDTGDGKYDPDDIPDPDDFTVPVGFDGNCVLTRTYAVDASILQNVGQKLWSQSYFNVLKIQSNPIDNIVAVKHFPFAMTGTSMEIKVGDVPFGINGDKISTVQIIDIGSYTYTGRFHNYLDLAPFTAVKLFLPYCGIVSLDPADILECKIGVKYYVDLVTGQCMARIFLDSNANGKAIPYMSVYGNMGIDIPLTATDRVQTEVRAASAAVSVMGSVAGHVLGGDALGAAVSGATGALNIAGADYNSQRTCAPSPLCSAFDTQDVFIMIERPASEYVESGTGTGYKHLHGLPSNKYRQLSAYPDGSFVQVDKRSDIKIAMTSDENKMLEELLIQGIYI